MVLNQIFVMMKRLKYFETSVTVYQFTQGNIKEVLNVPYRFQNFEPGMQCILIFGSVLSKISFSESEVNIIVFDFKPRIN